MSIIAILRGNRSFRLLLIGQCVSLVGDPLLPFALAYSALRSGEVQEFGWLLAARSAGTLVFTLIGGTLADERRQNRVMAACDALRLLLVVFIGVGLLAGSTLVTALLVFAFSSVGAFFGPALAAALPRVVDAENLQNANGLITISKRLGALLGPALGVILIEAVGVGGVLAVDAATFAISCLCFVLIRMEPVRAKRGVNIARKIQEGLTAVRDRRWLLTLIGLSMVQVVCCLAPWLALLPVVMSGAQYSIAAYGACLSVFAAGSVLGSMVAMRVRPRRPGTLSQLALVPFALVLIALGLGLPVPILLVLHLCAGFGTDLYAVLFITAVQRDVNREVLGRVLALDTVGSTALTPVAYAAIGLFGGAINAGYVLIAGGIIGIGVALLPLLDPQVRAYATVPATTSR